MTQVEPAAPDVATLCEGSKLPLNDFGNGQRIRLYMGGDILFVPRMGWFVWDGHRWEQDGDSMAIRRRAHRLAELVRREAFEIRPSEVDQAVIDAGEDAEAALLVLPPVRESTADQKAERARLSLLVEAGALAAAKVKTARDRHLTHARNCGNTNAINNMMGEAGPYVAAKLEAMNADPMLVNARNVTLEIAPNGDGPGHGVVVREQKREDRISKAMNVDYDPEAECPVFLDFLADIQPDPEMRAFLQRWFGCSITGFLMQKLVFLYGTGRNGKSTLVDVIAKIMDEYATTVPIESLTGSEMRKGSDATPDLVRLPGARMVRASEPEEGIRFREATVKSFTGGEPILVRKMREEFVEIEPVFKLTISGNHKPNVRGTDDGIWRRILLVPFETQIPKDEVDLLLPKKLWAERAGIFNWLLEGAVAFMDGGLREPASVVDATAEFREDSDPVRSFLMSDGWCAITGDPDHFEKTRDLVAVFQAYQREQGGQPWGNQTVQRRLREKAGVFRTAGGVTFSPHKRPDANGYIGIRITTAAWSAMSGGGDAARGTPAKLSPDIDDFV